jgi:hypothetical protein
MNSFYSTLFGKFGDLQIDQAYSAKFVYPSGRHMPSVKIGREISDCIVGVPAIEVTNNRISYGPFIFEDNEFGQAASVKLAVASSCLLSAKTVLRWSFREQVEQWLGLKKSDLARAEFCINVIFDILAKKRIRHVEGEEFSNDIMRSADMLGSILLRRNNPSDFGVLLQSVLASYLIGDPMHAAASVSKVSQDFVSKMDAIDLDPVGLVDGLKDSLSNGDSSKGIELEWNKIVTTANDLYEIINEVPGKWRLSSSLPYADAPDPRNLAVIIFKPKLIIEKELLNVRQRISQNSPVAVENDSLWLEIFFEMLREENRNQKIRQRLSRAAGNLNFGGVGFPVNDYVSYSKLYSELAPNIRRIVERVRLVKNALDENTFEESGNIDMQIAIQAVASETNRNDIFVKDENLLKSECWAILVDSSLSLDGSSRQLKSVSICLAETAREVMGTKPWGMFAFSDDLYCIKDFNEPYSGLSKARVGGLVQKGLSYIPDAIRACRKLLVEYSCDKNYLILVSDGIPSGYPGIEEEFTLSVKELGKYGVDLAAVGIGSSSIKKTIRSARIVDKPDDVVKEFTEIYYGLSS